VSPTTSYSESMPENLEGEREQRIQELARLVRRIDEADQADEKYTKTRLVRQLADLLIDLRLMFTTPDGQPDYTGRTWEYREAVRDIFSLSGIPRERAITLQALNRYHVGNRLRRRLTPDELETAGLLVDSPHERSTGARHERNALVRAVRGQDEDMDPAMVLSTTELLLRRLRPSLLERMDETEVADLEDGLSEVKHQLSRVERALDRVNSQLTVRYQSNLHSDTEQEDNEHQAVEELV
jgi:hypothetical protein